MSLIVQLLAARNRYLTLGIDLGFNYRGLEFSMLWQGVYNRDIYLSDWTLLEGFQSNNNIMSGL